MATYYRNVNNLSKSLEYHNESLSIIEKINGRNSREYADRLALRSITQYEKGDVERAINSLKESLDIIENTIGRDNISYMTFINNLSSMERGIGDYVEAIMHMAEALNIAENLYGQQSPKYATYLTNYAVANASLGKYQDAIRLLTQALDIQKKILRANHPDQGITLASLGSCYCKIGEYSEAIRLDKEALEIFLNSGGRENVYYVNGLNNLATVYYYLGNYAEADKYSSESYELASKIFDHKSQNFAKNLISRAALKSEIGETQEAINIDDEILEIYNSSIGNSNNEYATALMNKALNLNVLKRYPEAIETGEAALKLRENILGRLHLDYANTLQSLGGMYLSSGDSKTAVKYTQQSLSIRENLFSHNNSNYISSLMSLCQTQMASGNTLGATANAQKCIPLLTDLVKRRFLDFTAHERSLLWQTYAYWYNNVVPNIAYYSNRQDIRQSSYDALLFSKSLLLNSEIELSKLIAENGNEDNLKLYYSIADARRQLSKIYEQPLEKQKLKTDSIELYIQNTERQLIQQSKQYGDYTRRLNVAWQEVRDALGKNDIAIEFATFHNLSKSAPNDSIHYIAYVLKSGYSSPKIIHILSIPYDGEIIDEKATSDALLLGKKIWGPLKEELLDVKNIYFSPAGELHRLPLEYMSSWEDNDKMMADIYRMHRVSSTRELVINTAPPSIESASLFGGLTYGNNTYTERDFDLEVTPDDEIAIKYRDSFQSLEGTKVEVDNICQYLKKMNVKYELFTDSLGTEETFRSLSHTGLNLLHIASHGFYWTQEECDHLKFSGFLNPNKYTHLSDEDKALARSGILLSGAVTDFKNLTENLDPDDGIVTSKEISQLDFRGMDLAVLSACQTGLGDIKSDGVFGLQRGFKKAGVQTLLMTLWKVNDTATELLMSKFYESLASGNNKTDALLDAQRYVREYEIEETIDLNANLTANQRRKLEHEGQSVEPNIVTRKITPYSAPQFWAAFILLDAL